MEPNPTKWNAALDIVIESLQKPDSALRAVAREERCCNELQWIRNELIGRCREMRL